MKQTTLNSLIAALFVLASSCYKDKGNYTYEDPDKITILLVEGRYLSIRASDTLNIEPKLIYRGDTVLATQVTEIFSFTWYSNDQPISTGAVLQYPVRNLKGVHPYVKLKVINKNDESTFLEGFYVDAIPTYLTGWVVLTKKDNRSIISFIDPVTFEVMADFYTTMSGEELGPNAVEVKEHWMNGALSNPGNVLIVRNDASGNIELDGTDLNAIYNTNNFFLGNKIPAGFRPRGEFYMWDNSFMLDDKGSVYVRRFVNSAFSQSGVYSNKPMFIPGGVSFDKGWDGTFLSGQTILYDKTKGSLFLASDNSGLVLPVNYMAGPPIPPGTTLINAMDKELTYVGRLQLGRFNSSYYLIFFNGNQHFVQKIMVIDLFFTINALFFYETPFGAGTANAQSVFCQLPRIDSYMFYSGGSGNKTLYLYEHGPARSSEYFSFESPIKTITANQTTILEVHTHDQLMVGLENGDVYILGISSDHIVNPGQRLVKKIVLNQGVPVSTMYKMGFGFKQM